MKIFQKKKTCCSCEKDSLEQAIDLQKASARIKVLGSGCAKCTALENNTKEALKLLGKQESVEHITDFAQIASYGVMSTPALVVDNQVVTFGKVLSCDEIKEILLKVGF